MSRRTKSGLRIRKKILTEELQAIDQRILELNRQRTLLKKNGLSDSQRIHCTKIEEELNLARKALAASAERQLELERLLAEARNVRLSLRKTSDFLQENTIPYLKLIGKHSKENEHKLVCQSRHSSVNGCEKMIGIAIKHLESFLELGAKDWF